MKTHTDINKPELVASYTGNRKYFYGPRLQKAYSAKSLMTLAIHLIFLCKSVPVKEQNYT
jgi:hypothetical protein